MENFTHSKKRQVFSYSGLKSCYGMSNVSAHSKRAINNLSAKFYLGKNNKILILIIKIIEKY